MKTFFLLSVTWLSVIFAFGQKTEQALPVPYDITLQKYAYSKVIEVPEKDAQALYALAKNWYKQKYSDETFLINTENERLTHVGNFPIVARIGSEAHGIPVMYTVLYNATFLFKEGKTKLDITDIKLSENAQATTRETTLEAYKAQMENLNMPMGTKKKYQQLMTDIFTLIHTKIQDIISDAEATMKGQKSDGDDW